MQHRLSDINPELKIATCKICGPNSKITNKSNKQWACSKRISETTKRYRQRPEIKARYIEYLSDYKKIHGERIQNQIREWVAIHPEAQRDYNLRKFGVTPEQYEIQLQKQNGVCACCKQKCKSGRRLAIDHDHKTGRLRGLLCSSCNLGIGNLGDTIEGVQMALDYLKKEDTF